MFHKQPLSSFLKVSHKCAAILKLLSEEEEEEEEETLW